MQLTRYLIHQFMSDIMIHYMNKILASILIFFSSIFSCKGDVKEYLGNLKEAGLTGEKKLERYKICTFLIIFSMVLIN